MNNIKITLQVNGEDKAFWIGLATETELQELKELLNEVTRKF